MIGILSGLVVLELLVTALIVAILVWRGLVDLKEEDQLILFEYESQVEREQSAVRRKAVQVNRYLKMAGASWSAILVAIIGLWVVWRF